MITELWLDAPAYPFSHPGAVEFRDLLVAAYADKRRAEQIARSVPISLKHWRSDDGIEPAWNSLLDLAATQGLLRGLIEKILGDAQVQAYWGPIGRLIKASDPQPTECPGGPYKVALTHLDIADGFGLRRLLEEEARLLPEAARALVEAAETGSRPQLVAEGLPRAEACSLFRKIVQVGALAQVVGPEDAPAVPRLERTESGLPMALIPGAPVIGIAPFWLMCNPVTQALYRRVMNANPSRFRGNRRPVEGVTWDEAMRFCERLSAEEPDAPPYRLPTPREWEYAARADHPFPYSGSRHWPDVAWSEEDETRPVRAKKPNEWGLFDMSGNVWEWTQPEASILGGSAGGRQVIKGGCFASDPREIEIKASREVEPQAADQRIGFRVARSRS